MLLMKLRRNLFIAYNESRKCIREYIFNNPGTSKNNIAYDLGWYSGYGKNQKNWLAWSIIQNDDFIDSDNVKVKNHYESLKLSDYELYEMSQKNLQIILECILELLKITLKGLGNSKIARLLDIHTFVLINGRETQCDWFSWSCLSILYNNGCIDTFNKNNEIVDPYNKNGKKITNYKLRTNYDNFKLPFQDRLDINDSRSCGEQLVEKILLELKSDGTIKDFKWQKKFTECRHKKELPFDWRIIIDNDHNGLIEFDGEQHFAENKKFGKKSFISTQLHDKMKNDFCKERNKYLLRIDYTQCTKTLLKKHILEFVEAIKNKLLQNFVTYRGTKYDLQADNISEISKVNKIVKNIKSSEELNKSSVKPIKVVNKQKNLIKN